MPSPDPQARPPKGHGHRQRAVPSRQSSRLVVPLVVLSMMICLLCSSNNQANAPQQTDRLKRENYREMLLLRIIVPVVYR